MLIAPELIPWILHWGFMVFLGSTGLVTFHLSVMRQELKVRVPSESPTAYSICAEGRPKCRDVEATFPWDRLNLSVEVPCILISILTHLRNHPVLEDFLFQHHYKGLLYEFTHIVDREWMFQIKNLKDLPFSQEDLVGRPHQTGQEDPAARKKHNEATEHCFRAHAAFIRVGAETSFFTSPRLSLLENLSPVSVTSPSRRYLFRAGEFTLTLLPSWKKVN